MPAAAVVRHETDDIVLDVDGLAVVCRQIVGAFGQGGITAEAKKQRGSQNAG